MNNMITLSISIPLKFGSRCGSELRKILQWGIENKIVPMDTKAHNVGPSKMLFVPPELAEKIKQICTQYDCSRNAYLATCLELYPEPLDK